MKLLPAILTLLFLQVVSLQEAWAFSLDDLMNRLSKTSNTKAWFIEEKQLALLETPVISQGTLTYRAPDYIRKEVHQPEQSLFEIQGEYLYIETAEEQQSFSLDSHPLLRAFAESYRATLSGNRIVLERHFKTELSGTMRQWTLDLKPIEGKVQKHIEAIVLTGSEDRILMVKTISATGDTSLMKIKPDEN